MTLVFQRVLRGFRDGIPTGFLFGMFLAAMLFPGACRACRYSGSQSEPTFVFCVCVSCSCSVIVFVSILKNASTGCSSPFLVLKLLSDAG